MRGAWQEGVGFEIYSSIVLRAKAFILTLVRRKGADFVDSFLSVLALCYPADVIHQPKIIFLISIPYLFYSNITHDHVGFENHHSYLVTRIPKLLRAKMRRWRWFIPHPEGRGFYAMTIVQRPFSPKKGAPSPSPSLSSPSWGGGDKKPPQMLHLEYYQCPHWLNRWLPKNKKRSGKTNEKRKM